MGPALELLRGGRVDLSLPELTGAVGDLAVALPVVVAVAALTELSLAVMLVWFGLFQLAFGLAYGLPLSVEPMKALAALAIAGSLTAGEVALAGLAVGVILLVGGLVRALERARSLFAEPVIRGVQLAVALVLLDIAVDLSLADLDLTLAALIVALVVAIVAHRTLAGLAVVGLGLAVAFWSTGVASPAIPSLTVAVIPGPSTLTVDVVDATVAQLAMTVGNAALATAVVLEELHGRSIAPDKLSVGMGVMNLVAVPFGGLPMCHGSGGVAGKYAFGARTGGANVYLGVGYLAGAILAVSVLDAFPLAVLGVILVVVALQLGSVSLQREGWWLILGIGLLGFLVNVGLAFVVGVAVSVFVRRFA